MWGGWLLVTGLAFSFGQGIIHEYYTVALGPAIGAVAAIGAAALWKHRAAIWSWILMAATLGVAVWWATRLLDRSPGWHEASRPLLAVAAALVGIGLVGAGLVHEGARRWALGVLAVAAVVVATAAPVAASVTTARTPHRGPLPSAGPAVRTAGPGGRPGGFAVGPVGLAVASVVSDAGRSPAEGSPAREGLRARVSSQPEDSPLPPACSPVPGGSGPEASFPEARSSGPLAAVLVASSGRPHLRRR